MAAVQTSPFGSWRSPITSDLIVAETISLSEVMLDGDDVYWLEGRPRERGRRFWCGAAPTGASPTSRPHRSTSARGPTSTAAPRPLWPAGRPTSAIMPTSASDRLAPGENAVALTPPTSLGNDPDRTLRFADGLIDRRRNLWIGVREDHLSGGKEPINTLAAIDLVLGGPGQVLAQGRDFYSSPRLSPDGTRLAWLTWDHPNMPWVGTELWVARFDGEALADPVRVAGGPAESIFQPEWSPDGRLVFISDRSGWWNLYRREPDGSDAALCPRDAEFGQPQWVFGLSTYAFVNAGQIVCSFMERGLARLALLDLVSGRLEDLGLPYTDYGWVHADGRRVAFRAGSATQPSRIVLLDLATRAVTVVRTGSPAAEEPALTPYFTKPQPVEFPTEGGLTAHGLYYPPHNPDYSAPAGERPPLLVKCHGGPTGAASSALDLRIQFWTSRGIAVLDVNYSGSTGYGRAYRDRLHLAWGVVDVDDCVNGAAWLAAGGLADAERNVITGGSAGGYTTLAVLTFRNAFRAGGSHYGVSDLEALVHDTHKFESRYLDWLIGPYPEAKAVYDARSPVRHADGLKAPVIFFQGDEDRIVPPNQTEMMVEALRKKGVAVGYLLFAGEQHGFRRAENIKRALDAELYFFAAMAFRVGLTF